MLKLKKIYNWEVYKDGVLVEPLVYTTGKTQLDTINEIINYVRKGKNLILLKGKMGSGKSLISLIVARKMGGGVIVVPTKALQQQYEKDYGKGGRMEVSGLKIGVITGRANHKCKLYSKYNANHTELPCTRKLKTKKEWWCNKTQEQCIGIQCTPNPQECSSFKEKKIGETRLDATVECPHFVANTYLDLTKTDRFSERYEYSAMDMGRWGVLNVPDDPCSYYEQFISYSTCDVVVVNSWLHRLELKIGRLPKKPATLIDEIDSYLEQLSLKTTFTQHRLKKLEEEGSNIKHFDFSEYVHLENAFFNLVGEDGIKEDIYEGKMGVFMRTVKKYLKSLNTDYAKKYLNNLEDIERYSSTIAHISTKKGKPKIEFFVPEPRVVWDDYYSKMDNVVIGMSGTLPSDKTLNEVYGIVDYEKCVGEPKNKGTVVVPNNYRSLAPNYRSWQQERFREQYFKLWRELVKNAPKPLYVFPHGYKYMPRSIRMSEHNTEKAIKEFADGKREILYSTKIDRGVDFRHAKSCIINKFPWPGKDPLMDAMKKKLGNKAFNSFYMDMALRKFEQVLGRGQRDENQVLYFYSPDGQCKQFLKMLWKDFNIKWG